MEGTIKMEYNSLRDKLIIPEYGRNFQKLVIHAKTIEDKEERQLYVERIVELIYQMNPQSKNILEYKERLWGHVFRIADYDLDVTAPNGIMPTKEDDEKKPAPVPYPPTNRKFRHYGNHVNSLIKKAKAMEDPLKKGAFVELIANFMKIAFKNWNRDHYVTDEIVKADLLTMSDGDLIVPEDFVLVNVPTPPNQTNTRSHKGKRKGGSSKGRSNNNNQRSKSGRGGSNNHRRR